MICGVRAIHVSWELSVVEGIVGSVTAVGGSLDRLKGQRGPQSVLSRIILCLERMTSVMLVEI